MRNKVDKKVFQITFKTKKTRKMDFFRFFEDMYAIAEDTETAAKKIFRTPETKIWGKGSTSLLRGNLRMKQLPYPKHIAWSTVLNPMQPYTNTSISFSYSGDEY